ncbi:DUF6270 domain-containing protein [Alcaligenes faecalis]|uniref:DUF6270 domain-containing protein n=1 Tax=Alcaligenes faecalis TaxID=511 RepID=UPI0034D640A7
MGFYIYGGCATRDVFSMDSILPSDGVFSVRKYFSRTVPASLCHDPYLLNLDFEKDFHKRLFLDDSGKSFRDFLMSDLGDDFLILDFVSAVRFSLYDASGMVGTLTPQNKTALIKKKIKYKSVPCWSEDYLRFHSIGMSYFSDFIVRNRDKVILNKIYFSNVCSDGSVLDSSVDKYNLRLNEIYDFLEIYLNPSLVISFDSDVLVCDVDHKWGKDMFHYGFEYYAALAEGLKGVVSRTM